MMQLLASAAARSIRFAIQPLRLAARPVRLLSLLIVVVAVAAAIPARPCVAETATIAVGLDRWMYPFAFTGGMRTTAPTFGAVGSADFDNRDGQVLLGFQTASQVATGQGAASYQINSIRIKAMVDVPGDFLYDPTYDGYASYLAGGTDSDAGRPIELHGVGFRNGYTGLSFGPNDGQTPGFEESTAFGPQSQGTRNAYALGYLAGQPVDVSNNVDGTVESNPWSIGSANLIAGTSVPGQTLFTFELSLTDPNIVAYLQQGLNSGSLGFAITSLHEASQTGGPAVPQWIMRENATLGAIAPTLEIDYSIVAVPEPATFVSGLCGIAILSFVGLRLRRARHAIQ